LCLPSCARSPLDHWPRTPSSPRKGADVAACCAAREPNLLLRQISFLARREARLASFLWERLLASHFWPVVDELVSLEPAELGGFSISLDWPSPKRQQPKDRQATGAAIGYRQFWGKFKKFKEFKNIKGKLARTVS